MKVTGKQERLLRRALNEWQQEGTLTADDHQRLAGTLQRVTMDWQRLSRYAFWTALACVIIAIGSLFSDSELMARIIEFFAFSSLARIGLPALWPCCFICGASAASGGDAVALQYRSDFVPRSLVYRHRALAAG